jgi:hypothetical protein
MNEDNPQKTLIILNDPRMAASVHTTGFGWRGRWPETNLPT